MEYTKNNLRQLSEKTGFLKDNLEKLLRLVEILKILFEDDFLKHNLVLKGGTAINLIYANLPRLSVDLDFDLAINYSKEELDNIKIKDKIVKHLQKIGYTLLPHNRTSFALSSLHFSYTNNGGNKDVIKIDLNYLDRNHVLDLDKKRIAIDFIDDSFEIVTLNITEIYASKLNALISRGKVRDLYDVKHMIENNLVSDINTFRKCLILYNMATGNQDIDKGSFEKIDSIDYFQFKTALKPLLTKADYFDIEETKAKAKTFIKDLVNGITDSEKEFIECIKNGEYKPSLLFDESDIVIKIQNFPSILWRCKK